ncbi:hypothetical protein BJY04DRAFT_135519 [Aspergillus karnatakaensis]|uniref:uncharacterized protein n=1 Tax=Aspergillus karnatakaensis TaxID=1810916 RepID=UPI003CCE2F0E
MSLFRQCGRPATAQLRGFSTSSNLRVGPESPYFVDVPQPVQPALRANPRVKGTLPVPREIFPRRRVDKPTEPYIAAATPLPTKQKAISPDEPHSNYREWKKGMAEMRRQNLRQGLLELHTRKRQVDKAMETRSREKQTQRRRVLQQPDRDDELLTRTSVIQEMLPRPGTVLPDPGRDERLAHSRKQIKIKKFEKERQRLDSLHTLYMNARNFITTEDQLAKEIEKAFPEGENPAWASDHVYGENIWNTGLPTNVSLTQETQGHSWDMEQKRIKKLGEEITGGKI